MVCVSPEKLAEHDGDIDSAVTEMMAPYQENNMGDCPDEYLEFNDIEDEYRERYENDTSPWVRCPDGLMVYPWDKRFRVEGSFGIGSGTHKVPEDQGYEEIDIPLKEMYSTFEECMADYCGYKKCDPKTGRYGYWENRNSKWDYWLVGGRWSGYFFVKPGTETAVTKGSWYSPEEFEENTTDICRIADLDLLRIEAEMLKRAKKFWDEFVEFRKTGKVPEEDKELYTVRGRAMDVGLLEVVEDPEEGKKRGGFRWADTIKNLREDDNRRDWYDVINQDITKEEFLSDWLGYYCPIRTFAALDDNGWHEAGKMGWWGMNLASPETCHEYSQVFMDKFIYEKDPETILVVCDCHI
jgi:hypothetical protein